MAHRDIILIGGGGHAAVVADAARAAGRSIRGYVDMQGNGDPLLGAPCLGTDDALPHIAARGEVDLLIAVGSVRNDTLRSQLYERFLALGYGFATICHPSATLGTDVRLGAGSVVMAGAVLQVGSRTGVNVIVNTKASVDHHGLIGDHVHLGPGATLSGNVSVGARSLIGAGATVIQGVRIGADVTLGAGAVAVFNIPDGATGLGCPARVVSTR